MNTQDSVLVDLVTMFFQMMAPAITLLVTFYIRKWFKIKVSAQQQHNLDILLDKAIAYADQNLRSLNLAKRSDGDKRLEWAAGYVRDNVRKYSIPLLAQSAITQQLEARLGQTNDSKEVLKAVSSASQLLATMRGESYHGQVH